MALADAAHVNPLLMVAGGLARLSQADLKAALSAPTSAPALRLREEALAAVFRSTPTVDELLG